MSVLEKEQQKDEFISTLMKKKLEFPFFEKNGFICYGKANPPVVVIPESMKRQFLEAIHNHPTSGHLGRDKTIQKAHENGWWPSMNKEIIQYIQACMSCKLHKTPTHKYKQLTSIEVDGPGEMWAADVAFLPVSKQGNRYLLVFMEYQTKWVVTAALPTFDTNSIANVLLYSIILVHGNVTKFLTDNGANFIAEAIQVICKRLGIKKLQTSVEHPQSDGLVERMNRTIRAALAIYCEKSPEDWDIYLPFVTFAINTSKQASTGYTPFEALYGRKAKLPSLQELPNVKWKTYTTESWLAHLNHYIPILQNNIHSNIQRSQKLQQHYYNRGRKEKNEFVVGDIVLKIKMKEQWKFPNPKFSGPWKIVAITSPANDAFKLEEVNETRSRNYKLKKITTANIKDIYKV